MKIDRDLGPIRKKVNTDPDYVNSKKYQYSLKKFLNRHPDGVTDNIISYLLCVTTDEVKGIYNRAVKKLRQAMKVDVE